MRVFILGEGFLRSRYRRGLYPGTTLRAWSGGFWMRAGWRPYWSYWLGESLGVIARGLFLWDRGWGLPSLVYVLGGLTLAVLLTWGARGIWLESPLSLP